MLFSENKWDDAAELNQYIPVSSALSFEKMESSFRNAEELFIVPVFGIALMEKVQEAYENEDGSDMMKKLIRHLQTAEANLAWWYDFDEHNVRITDQGIQRQQTENFTSAYKYQEDNLRSSFKTKGFNAIDNAIEYCIEHVADFPDFKNSVAYENRRTALVKGMREAERIYSIHGSSLVWLRLVSVLREQELTVLPSVIGMTCFDAITDALGEGRELIESEYSVEKLRERIARWLVTSSIAKMIRRSGAITDRGLYFENVVATSISGSTQQSADRERIIMLATEIEKTAEAYRTQLVHYIETHCPKLFTGRESDVLNRDNDGKRTFFA